MAPTAALTGTNTAWRYLCEASPSWSHLAIAQVAGVPTIEHDIVDDDWEEHRVLGGAG